MPPHQSSVRNQILARMHPDDFQLLAPHLHRLALPAGFLIAAKDAPIRNVYFPESGVGSVTAVSGDEQAEAALFGFDGLAPVGAVMGIDRVHKRESMQVGGEGYSINRRDFDAALASSLRLRHRLNAFVYVTLIQATYTGLSNAWHSVDQRLARWLLMCDDRNFASELHITHKYIAMMLAVRRPSVTAAFHALEAERLIRAQRGVVVIRNRSGLERFAGDAYGAPEKEYERLLGASACANSETESYLVNLGVKGDAG